MMGLMAVHGAQAGSFSPISIYGGIVNKVLERNAIVPAPMFLFWSSAAFNAVVALIIWTVYARRAQIAHAHLPADGHRSPAPAALDRDGAWTLAGLAATDVLLVDPRTTLVEPLVQRLLLQPSEAVQPLWQRAQLDVMTMAELIAAPMADIHRVDETTKLYE